MIPLVSLDDVTLHYDGHIVAEHVTWAMYPGQHWAVTGPTGSGKSLLARAIAGMMPLIGGEVRYGATESAPACVPVAYVTFQPQRHESASFHQARWHADVDVATPTVDACLSPHGIWHTNPFVVGDGVPLPATPAASDAPAETPPLSVAEAFRERRDHVIRRFELGSLLGRELHTLSDGEWRRVQIARALLKAPRILILDDPFTGLDVGFCARLRQVLTHLMNEGTHLLLLLPEADDLPEGLTHILVLHEGEIVKARPISSAGASSPGEPACPGRTGGPMAPATQRADWQRTPSGGAVTALEAEISQPVIEMQGVSVTHCGTQVLEAVDWTVHRGEKWALLGPNGAGKTTLLSLILGDHPQAYANTVRLFGQQRGSGESIWEIKQRIGWVSPELQRAYPPQATVSDVVRSGFFDTLGLFRRCSAEQDARAEAWLARLGVAQCRDSAFRRVSKGEQRLALIARALVKDPELLILDEPCQGLDPQHCEAVVHALDTIAGESDVTMIYVTHRQQEFPTSLTHVLLLERGRVVRGGPLGSFAPG